MMFHVRLSRFRGVVRGVLIMAVREMRVMRRRFMLPVFVVLGRLLVVMRRVLVNVRPLRDDGPLLAWTCVPPFDCAEQPVELQYRLPWLRQIARA
jgi:hypothetical protein